MAKKVVEKVVPKTKAGGGERKGKVAPHLPYITNPDGSVGKSSSLGQGPASGRAGMASTV